MLPSMGLQRIKHESMTEVNVDTWIIAMFLLIEIHKLKGSLEILEDCLACCAK